jgi:uncharacterized DUF497 family protein
MKFEWDPEKAAANLQKHNVSFEEAATVFYDIYAYEELDDRFDEPRFQRVGTGSDGILYVVYTIRGRNEDIYRLISARRATAKEIEIYFELRQ